MVRADIEHRRSRCWPAVFLLIALNWFVSTAQAQPVEVRIDTASERVDLSPLTWLLEDPEGKLTLEDVRSPSNAKRFAPGSSKIGNTTSAYWLRYRIRTGSPQALERWFDSGNRRLQEIDLFVLGEGDSYQRQSASSTQPFADRPL